MLPTAVTSGSDEAGRAKVFNEEETIRQAVAQTPGVAEAGVTLESRDRGILQNIEIQSKPATTRSGVTPISPQLLSLLSRCCGGEFFKRRSAATGSRGHGEAFVKQYLGDVDPIGQSVRIPFLKTWDCLRYLLNL